MITYIEDKALKEEIARNILSNLPDWFGVPQYVEEYVHNSRNLPFWAAMVDGNYVGFITLKETSKYAVEIHVMGILKEYHRQGIGRKLFEALHTYAKEQGYSFLQVKTVDAGYYEDYDRTRLFYESLGFKALECFPTLWDAQNPCLVLVMSL